MKVSELDKQPDPTENTLENLIAIVIVLLLIGGITWWVLGSSGTPAPQDDVRVQLGIGDAPTVGSPDAPVTVILFSDFECPYCGQFAQGLPEIERLFLATGTVELVYKHYPLPSHPASFLAAEAAMCADDQDAFWPYHNILYINQDALTQDDLLAYAAGIVPDADAFAACLASGVHREDVLRDKQEGIDAGVTGTPTFFFNGRRVLGALTPERFAEEVARELP